MAIVMGTIADLANTPVCLSVCLSVSYKLLNLEQRGIIAVNGKPDALYQARLLL